MAQTQAAGGPHDPDATGGGSLPDSPELWANNGLIGDGRYRLTHRLGRGGMAEVFGAEDLRLGRTVAVKLLRSDLAEDPVSKARFTREAQSVAGLNHHSVVAVYDSGEEVIGGNITPYIVMELVEGSTIRDLLLSADQPPTDQALIIVSGVLDALAYSHQHGIVHRDIKPANVIITTSGAVKVMDFGIARALHGASNTMTQTGMVMGTPQYLSPEQALGRGVDARSDLYSVGIMLFELLTGRLPFDADSPLAIAYAHVQEEPPTPSSINQSIPAAVDALVARSLKKNPNERFPSADAMHDECTRIGGSGVASGASPIIISGGPPANSGAGVGQAVFPPVDAGAQAQQGGVQTPYQPPQGQPGPYNSGGFGPSTPPPPTQASPSTAPTAGYGYPQASGGGPSTPPPYTIGAPGSGQPGQGGPGKKPTGAMVGYGVAGVAVIVALVFVIIGLTGDDGKSDKKPTAKPKPTKTVQPGGSGGSGGDSGGDDSGGYKGPDKSRTIDKTKCTDATESYSDKSKVLIPDLTIKDLTSVKACLRAAGWKLGDVTKEDENVWGKNTVLEQNPNSIEDFDPKKDKIDLTVSTGQPAD
jgi:serine/threonine protein kinase